MFFECPKCHRPIVRHDFIYGYVCDGPCCNYWSNEVFSGPVPAGLFGLGFLKRLLGLSDNPDSGTKTPS